MATLLDWLKRAVHRYAAGVRGSAAQGRCSQCGAMLTPEGRIDLTGLERGTSFCSEVCAREWTFDTAW